MPVFYILLPVLIFNKPSFIYRQTKGKFNKVLLNQIIFNRSPVSKFKCKVKH